LAYGVAGILDGSTPAGVHRALPDPAGADAFLGFLADHGLTCVPAFDSCPSTDPPTTGGTHVRGGEDSRRAAQPGVPQVLDRRDDLAGGLGGDALRAPAGRGAQPAGLGTRGRRGQRDAVPADRRGVPVRRDLAGPAPAL